MLAFIDMAASWAQRIFGDRIFAGGTILSFASSFLAPAISTFGLPAIIILITGLGSAIFLSVSLLLREFSEKKGLKKEEQISETTLNHEREKQMDKILMELPSSNQERQAILCAQFRILYRHLPESKKKIIEQVAETACGKNATQEQKSMIYTLLEKFEPFRDKVNSLTPKILEAIKSRSISKQSIEFLSSITDDDLEILKKQLKYVLRLPHQDTKAGLSSKDLAICNFENNTSKVQDLLLKDGQLIHLESYCISFYGIIWVGEGARASCYIPQKQSETISAIDNSELFDLQISLKQVEPKKGELVNTNATKQNEIHFRAYVCLSKIGIEIFNLLRDELEPAPKEYLSNLIEYWNKANPLFNFSLSEKTQLITNDNA